MVLRFVEKIFDRYFPAQNAQQQPQPMGLIQPLPVPDPINDLYGSEQSVDDTEV